MRGIAETQISAFLENKPGVVANLCTALTERGINIKAFTVLDTIDVGTVRIVVDDIEEAELALAEAGAAFTIVPVVAIPIPNRPGGFAFIARKIAEAGVNIEYFYATAMPGVEQTLGIFRVSDTEKALQIEFDAEDLEVTA